VVAATDDRAVKPHRGRGRAASHAVLHVVDDLELSRS